VLVSSWTTGSVYASILINDKGAINKMGLVTRRSQQLDKLFDQFAVDPKIKPLKKKPADEKADKKKNEDKKK
jgi:hypothetical protein